MRPKHERQAGAAPPWVVGTRFRPADPDAVRQRFAAIRARAFERVAEEERLIMARLAAKRWLDRGLSDNAPPAP